MKINFSMEDIINKLDLTKKQKEDVYMCIGNFNKKDGEVIWKDYKIKSFKLYQSMNYINLNIEVTKDGIEISKSKN